MLNPGFLRRVISYLNLRSEIEFYDKIHDTIEKDVVIKGTNLWILMFAIGVASVGLNVNSTAVIIGAMLISPLMGPIMGIGYSIATYDFVLLRSAIKNLLFAVGASLTVSTVYFSITPVSTAYSELLARTSPTIYDVLIALFGGLACIVATSSQKKGNVIPGAAIATALMPPLCTAGYGLATGQFSYFFGAFYLFTINAVFIALAALLISQLLNFPIRGDIAPTQKKQINQLISVVLFVTIIPSLYFGYGLVQKERFTENAKRFIKNVTLVEGNFLLNSEVDAERKSIRLIYGGSTLSDAEKLAIKEKRLDFGLNNADLRIEQGIAFGDKNSQEMNEIVQLRAEVNRLNTKLKATEKARDSIANRTVLGKKILTEIRSLYPEVTACTYADAATYTEKGEQKSPVLLILYKSQTLGEDTKIRLKNWVKARTGNDNTRLYFIPESQ